MADDRVDFVIPFHEGKGSPQRPVRPDFNMEEANRMLNEYSGGHQSFPVAQGIVDEFVAKYKETHKDVKYSFRGVNKDGIEVYETSEDVKKLSYKERQKVFHRLMTEEYRGRTEKFVRNGHAYYATFDEKDVNKNIYGDKLSDQKGWKAKINVGADGNIFELVENARYDGSKPEKGKKIAAHRGVGYWDYFIKNVQIDNIVFDLTANVRKKTDGAFVYSIQLKQNKKIKASPPLGLLLKAFDGVPNASENRVTQTDDEVKMSARDSEYMSAVESGDMEAAQRMVDEAAKAAWYAIKAWQENQTKDSLCLTAERLVQPQMPVCLTNKKGLLAEQSFLLCN